MIHVGDIATTVRGFVADAARAVADMTATARARVAPAARWLWAHRPNGDVAIGIWALTLAAVIIMRATPGTFVSIGGAFFIALPAYCAVFWLIHERQAAKDEAEEATRTAREALRTAAAVAAMFDDDAPPTGRHAR